MYEEFLSKVSILGECQASDGKGTLVTEEGFGWFKMATFVSFYISVCSLMLVFQSGVHKMFVASGFSGSKRSITLGLFNAYAYFLILSKWFKHH